MSWNKFRFKDRSEFSLVTKLAMEQGIETVEEFNKYLEKNYNHLRP
jgi:hypothetical protein